MSVAGGDPTNSELAARLRQCLRQVDKVTGKGAKLQDNLSLLRGNLADNIPEARAARKALLGAAECGAADILRKNGSSNSVERSRCVQLVKDELCLSEEWAQRVVAIWIEALGGKSSDPVPSSASDAGGSHSRHGGSANTGVNLDTPSADTPSAETIAALATLAPRDALRGLFASYPAMLTDRALFLAATEKLFANNEQRRARYLAVQSTGIMAGLRGKSNIKEAAWEKLVSSLVDACGFSRAVAVECAEEWAYALNVGYPSPKPTVTPDPPRSSDGGGKKGGCRSRFILTIVIALSFAYIVWGAEIWKPDSHVADDGETTVASSSVDSVGEDAPASDAAVAPAEPPSNVASVGEAAPASDGVAAPAAPVSGGVATSAKPSSNFAGAILDARASGEVAAPAEAAPDDAGAVAAPASGEVAAAEPPSNVASVGEDSYAAGCVKALILPGNVRMEFAWCPPGTFTMGSPDDELGHQVCEVQHSVTLTRGFWMARYPTTQLQYMVLMGGDPSRTRVVSSGPVEMVSWYDAVAFCEKVNERLSSALPKGFRCALPTEAQWEYACRAGTTSALNSGCELTSTEGFCPKLDAVAWYNANSWGTKYMVGANDCNNWGLYDMHGDVWEWCRDCGGIYSVGSVTDPVCSGSGSGRIARGGSFVCAAKDCRSASRGLFEANSYGPIVGFRPVLTSR